MKFSLCTAALLLTVTAASAQISPSEPQRGGTLNQTTVPPQNPANPTINPGTIDQRTPTTSNPTQTSLPGAPNQRPTTMPAGASGTMRRGVGTQSGMPRTTTTNSRRVRTVTNPVSTTPAGTIRP
ncbi:hypothetical protein [Hymenobacter sp. 102]|uniref:hypothetical protein n=1 Tax=Hymenobacter sp. 102 TaxID=3403152 RepID=UPI003CF2C7A4